MQSNLAEIYILSRRITLERWGRSCIAGIYVTHIYVTSVVSGKLICWV